MANIKNIPHAQEVIQRIRDKVKKHNINQPVIIQPLFDIERELTYYSKDFDNLHNQAAYAELMRVLSKRLTSIEFLLNQEIATPGSLDIPLPLSWKIIIGLSLISFIWMLVSITLSIIFYFGS